jgi:hypothetical protein
MYYPEGGVRAHSYAETYEANERTTLGICGLRTQVDAQDRGEIF